MGGHTTKAGFPLTLKSIADAADSACGDRTAIYVQPPENALTIESCYIHFKFTFDVGVAAPMRYIKDVGIVDAVDSHNWTYSSFVTLGTVADGSRKVDISMDISRLLKATNVKYTDNIISSSASGFTLVMFRFDPSLVATSPTGTIDLWKVDQLFTTDGIR